MSGSPLAVTHPVGAALGSADPRLGVCGHLHALGEAGQLLVAPPQRGLQGLDLDEVAGVVFVREGVVRDDAVVLTDLDRLSLRQLLRRARGQQHDHQLADEVVGRGGVALRRDGQPEGVGALEVPPLRDLIDDEPVELLAVVGHQADRRAAVRSGVGADPRAGRRPGVPVGPAQVAGNDGRGDQGGGDRAGDGEPDHPAMAPPGQRGSAPTQVGLDHLRRWCHLDGARRPVEQLFDVTHVRLLSVPSTARSPVSAESSASDARSCARPRAVWLLTGPSLQPRASAVSATLASWRWRRMTAARIRGGSSASARKTAASVSDGGAASTATSGTSAWFCSWRAYGRRRSSRWALTSILRAYASRVSERIRGHDTYMRSSTV